MGFGVLEDKRGNIEVAVFGATYKKYKTLFAADAFVVIKGSVTESRDGYKINVRELLNPKTDKADDNDEAVYDEPKKNNVTLWLKMDERDDEKYGKLVDILQQYEGEIPVKLKMEGKIYALQSAVRKCSGVEYELGMLLGEKNVIFFEK